MISFLRFAFLIVSAGIAISSFHSGLMAQSPEQPISVPAKIRVSGGAKQSFNEDPSSVSLYIDAFGGNITVAGAYYNPTSSIVSFSSGTATAALEPGKLYYFSVYTENVNGFSFQVSPPPGFEVEIENLRRTGYSESVSVQDYSNTYSVRVLAPGMTFSGRAGTASSIQSGRVFWQVALGSLRSGSSAGALAVVDAARSSWSALFTPAGLSYESESDEVYVHRENGVIRQVSASEAFVDVVVIDSTSYELRFYHPSQVPSGGYPKGFSDRLPFVTYKLERDSSDTKLKITSQTRTLSSATDTSAAVARTATTTVERSGEYPSCTWTLVDWTTTGQAALGKEVRTWTSDGNNGHTEVRKIVSVYGGTAALQVDSTHAKFDWAHMPTAVTAGTTDAATTNYEYYTDSAQSGSYAMAKSRKSTGDSWDAYQYFSDSGRLGMIQKRFRPYLDSPTAVNTTDENSGEVTRYDYVADAFGMLRRPALIETKVNGTVTARADISYATGSANSKSLVVATRLDKIGSGTATLQTITKYYPESLTDEFFRGKLHSMERADGTKDAYVWQRGDLSGATFTANASGSSSRTVVIHGISSSASAGSLLSSFDGYTIDNIRVVSGKSTRETVLRDAYARIVRTETHVWDGSTWQQLSWQDLEYDLSNLLTKRTNSNGAIYEAQYAGELKQWERDETGIKVSYTYTADGRVFRATKEGANGLPDLITEYAYDAAGRVVKQDTYASGGFERLGSVFTYDDAGRLSSESSPGRGVTRYTYKPATRKRTTVYPEPAGSEADRVEEYYVDGALKSVTGSAVVAQYYSYGVDTSAERNGQRYVQVNTSASNSVRWSKTWADWAGRTVRSERPGAPGQATSYEVQTYTGAFLTATERLGYAKTLYEYDEVGQLKRSGLDLNSNGQLDTTGTDRITGGDSWIVQENGAWWQATRSYTYPFNNDGTETTLGSSRVRLSSFTGNLRAETKKTDAEGETVSTTVSVNRGVKTVTTSTTQPDLLNPQVETVINGLHTSVQQPDGRIFTTGYDVLQRPVTSSDPRTGLTTTSYYPGTVQISSVKDPAGNVVVSNGYDRMGRIAWSRDAGGHNTLYSYTEKGALYRQWGDAAYPVSYDYNSYGERTTQHTYQQENNWHNTSWPGGTPTSTTTWTYDAATGLVTRKTDASGTNYVDYDYNNRGQVWHRYWMRKLADNVTPVTTTYGYDSQTGELTSTSYNDGTPTVGTTYTRMGKPDTVSDVTGTRDFIYDTNRPWRLSTEGLDATFYAGRMLTMVYNEWTTPNGNVYGPYTTGWVKGRLSGYKLGSPADPAADLDVHHAYSNTGRFGGVTSKWRTKLSETGLSTRDFVYGYEANSALVDYVQAGSYTQYYDYEAKRNIRTLVEAKWSTTSKTRYEFRFNALGQVTAAGQSGEAFNDYGSNGIHHRYAYNARGEVTEAVAYDGNDLDSTSSPLMGRFHQFGYDAAGNRTSANHTGVTGLENQFSINALNQITARENNLVSPAGTAASGAKVIVNGQTAGQQGRAWSAEVLPDNLNVPAQTDVRTTAALGGSPSYYKIDIRKAVTMRGGETLTYDSDGNLSSDDRWDYTWDAENRLVAMTTKAWADFDPTVERLRLEFRYDYLGRRVSKKVYKWSGSAYPQTPREEYRYLYQGWNLIAEMNGSSTLLRTYTWGLDLLQSLTSAGGVGALLQIADHTGAGDAVTYFPGYDGNGNIVSLLRASDGALKAKYEYSPFGELLRCEGDYAKTNPFRFSTKFTDIETGLSYYGHRYHSAALGRFINRDPIEESGGLNLYAFVRNNPVTSWDYLGWADQTGRDEGTSRQRPRVRPTALSIAGATRYDFVNGVTMEGLQGVQQAADFATAFEAMFGQTSLTIGEMVKATAVGMGSSLLSHSAFVNSYIPASEESPSGLDGEPLLGYQTKGLGSIVGGFLNSGRVFRDYAAEARALSAYHEEYAAWQAVPFSNLSLRGGASVNVVMVGSDAALAFARTGLSGEIEGAVGAPTGIGAIAYATIQGAVPLYDRPTDFSVGFLAAPIVAFGIKVDFSKSPTPMTKYFGWRYTPTSIKFDFGLGLGGNFDIDTAASKVLIKVERSNDGDWASSSVFDPK